jgi:hypothetical protein
MRLSLVVVGVVCLSVSSLGCGNEPEPSPSGDPSKTVRIVHASIARKAPDH